MRLGAHLTDTGADFAVYSPHAEAVDLCLLGEDGCEHRYRLHPAYGTWAGHIPGVRAGQRYGYRIRGQWAPYMGLRFNPAKLLLDPYARAISGTPHLSSSLYPHNVNEDLTPILPRTPNMEDSAGQMCWGVVLPPSSEPVTHPYTPWDHTVIYEGHVKGLTQLNPALPEELRGTYAGLAHPASIESLVSLGVSAVELLPIHAHMSEPFLAAKGLSNYWGYNTLAYFAPEPSYATQAAQEAGPEAVVEEVREMVARLHEAGIEVILDVVYNHTCEGGIDGPSLSWRGIDATNYYMQESSDPGKFMDTTGCGNSLDFRRHKVVQMTLDSLRYWVEEIGVDGFRFDLAVTLARGGEHFDSRHPLYVAMATDPILSNVKLINEPWDVGPNGWQTGHFCPPTADWNDHFRDTVRSFWVAQPRSMSGGASGGDLRDLATRLAGSADLFGHGRVPGGRGIYASLNFVTAHDGFTLHDLVAYNTKHNEANLEGNRDGSDNNKSWNHGVEGAIDPSSPIHGTRLRAMRNLMGTLLLSAGTPMLTAGDEIARTQRGNNNSYCQDNTISWINWDLKPWQEDLRATVAYLLRLRREHRVLRPLTFYSEGGEDSAGMRDLQWLDASGSPMPEHMWFDVHERTLQMLRSGRGEDADILILMNGSLEDRRICLARGRELPWQLAWDSTWPRPRQCQDLYAPGAPTNLAPLSMKVYLSVQS